VAEWLGRGLQNLVQQFKSARDLKRRTEKVLLFCFFQNTKPCTAVQICLPAAPCKASAQRGRQARDLEGDSEMNPLFCFFQNTKPCTAVQICLPAAPCKASAQHGSQARDLKRETKTSLFFYFSKKEEIFFKKHKIMH
jgi:hypothetical protein